jgi:hypothetical protein
MVTTVLVTVALVTFGCCLKRRAPLAVLACRPAAARWLVPAGGGDHLRAVATTAVVAVNAERLLLAAGDCFFFFFPGACGYGMREKHILASAERRPATGAHKVAMVPESTFGLGALQAEDELLTFFFEFFGIFACEFYFFFHFNFYLFKKKIIYICKFYSHGK